MKVAICSLFVLVGFSVTVFSRTWTRSDGKTVAADIQYYTEEVVALKLENGQEFSIPILEMSLEDQAYLKTWEPKRPIQVPEGAVFHQGRWLARILDKTPASKALEKAKKMGGHLVRIRDQETQAAVVKLADGLAVWIDGSDEEVEGLWVFSNGEKMEFKNWYKGQPDNYRQHEHFVYMRSEGDWQDYGASPYRIVGYIVEWE